MSLATLPDVCLLRLFSHTPLPDLLYQIPLVCSRWASLQPAALLARRSLSLFNGTDPLHLIHRSSFVVPFRINEDGILVGYQHNDTNRLSFEEQPSLVILNQILSHFPNVTHLELAQRDIHSTAIDSILALLKRYSTQLISLRLWLSYADEDVASQRAIVDRFSHLLDAINGLPSLRHLTFYCRHQLLLPGQPSTSALHLPIFRRLYTLQWFTFDSADELLQPSLVQYAQPNEALRQIELQNLISNHSLERLLSLEDPFTCRFTNLDISFASIRLNQLQIFAERFRLLTTLYIYLESIPLTQYAHCLRQLPHLEHLRVDVNFEYYHPSVLSTLDDTVPQLPQVQFLSMRLITLTHKDLHQLHPHWIFPHLRVVQVVNLTEHCHLEGCSYDYPDITADARMHCTRRLLQPFAACRELVKVCALKDFIGDDQMEWTIEQLREEN